MRVINSFDFVEIHERNNMGYFGLNKTGITVLRYSRFMVYTFKIYVANKCKCLKPYRILASTYSCTLLMHSHVLYVLGAS